MLNTISIPTEATPDAELVSFCLLGNQEAFRELVRRYQSLVCAVAYNATGNFAVSEEVAQETFINAWQRLAELREPMKLRSWLASIAQARAVDHVRKRKPETPIDECLNEIPAEGKAPDEMAASSEEAALVWQALDSLPEATRLPLILFYREGQSIRTVATSLELSEDTVRQRLVRGRAVLRDRLESLAEAVLGRTRPTAAFTLGVMAVVATLPPPAALAAHVLVSSTSSSAAAAASTAASTSTSTSISTSTVAAISAMKTSLSIAAAVAALSVPLGWAVHGPQARSVALPQALGKIYQNDASDFKNTALYAEWLELHDKHGKDPEDMPQLYEVISKIADPFRRRVLRAALIAEWAQLDAPAALQHFRRIRINDFAEYVVREWMQRDASEAVQALIHSGEGWQDVVRPLLTEIAQTLPSMLPNIVSQLPLAAINGPVSVSKLNNLTSVERAFAALAAGDASAAANAAEATSGACRTQALSGVAKAWVVRDSAAALAWIEQLPAGPDRDAAMGALVVAWAEHSPMAALQHLSLEHVRHMTSPPSSPMTDGQISRNLAVAAAARKDLVGTLAWLYKQPGVGNILQNFSEVLLEKLHADALGTLQSLATMPSEPLAMQMRNVLMNDGYGHAEVLRKWLANQPPSEFVDQLTAGLLMADAKHDPQKLLQGILSLAPEKRTQQGDTQLAKLLLDSSQLPAAQMRELLATADPSLWKAVVQQYFGSATFSRRLGDFAESPTDLLPLIAELPETERPPAMENVSMNLAMNDPAQAVLWVSSQAAGAQRVFAYAGTAEGWASVDSHEASKWVQSLEPSSERDAAAASLARTIGPEDTEAAWRWAQSITDETLRANAIADTIVSIGRKQASAGEAAFQAMGPQLPSDLREITRQVLDEKFGRNFPSRLRGLQQAGKDK